MDLPLLLRQHPERTFSVAFEWLNAETCHVQKGLPNHQGDFALRQRIISACYGCPELRPVLLEPPSDAEGVCNKIRAQIAQLEFTSSIGNFIWTMPVQNSINIADRHYNTIGNYHEGRKFLNRGATGNSVKIMEKDNIPAKRAKRCLVCQESNCLSTNHAPGERQRAYDRINHKFPGKNDTKVRQFIVNFEGLAQEDELNTMVAECEAKFEDVQIIDNDLEYDDPGYTGLIEEIGAEASVTYFSELTAEHLFTAQRVHHHNILVRLP
ncbi:hypothetical protein K3495_g713 [Podosphaera aphanis]|nr:hypothetical protein K3495_g713 [Podosphaera aphanis]